MSATSVPPSSVEPGIDHSLVQSLAREYGRTEHDVEAFLREELGRLAEHARIGTFLTVRATSNVRVRLRTERNALA